LIYYFDASALVKRYTKEPNSEAVRRSIGKGLSCTSRLSQVEIASALIRRAREGAISQSDRDRALSALTDDMAALYVVELSTEITSLARGLLLRNRLRAIDAIQLASCVYLRERTEREVCFVAFDDRLNDAAFAEGLKLHA
jgi:predicted nucleic acid-binding protein